MHLRATLALVATTALVPAAALAQSDSDGACDRLLHSMPENSALTREQVEQYQANNNEAACQAALDQVGQTNGGMASADDPAASPAEVTVEGGAASIDVEQAAPQITIEQPQSQVTVQRGQPEVIIHQPAPRISIEIPPPQITFRMPPPDVNVETPEPQVSVNQAKPEVRVVSTPDDEDASDATITANASETPQPIIHYDAEKAQVEVTQSDQPTVRLEQASQDDLSAGANQAATSDADAEMTDQQTQQQSDTTEQTVDQNTAGAEIEVSRLQGMAFDTGNGNGDIGTVSAVIMDARDRPFLIIDGSDGQQFAVMTEYTELRGDRLVLIQPADPSQLPRWTADDAGSNEIRQLSDNDTVRVRGAT